MSPSAIIPYFSPQLSEPLPDSEDAAPLRAKLLGSEDVDEDALACWLSYATTIAGSASGGSVASVALRSVANSCHIVEAFVVLSICTKGAPVLWFPG